MKPDLSQPLAAVELTSDLDPSLGMSAGITTEVVNASGKVATAGKKKAQPLMGFQHFQAYSNTI